MPNLIFWMNMPSFYQADLFRALLRRDGVSVKAIFTEKIPEDRMKLGWQDDLGSFDYQFLDERHPVRDAFSRAVRHRGDLNIVSGLWAGKVTEAVLAALYLSRSKYFIYSEAPNPRESVSPLKLKLLLAFGKPIVRTAAGLLPISHFAYDYFKSYGANDSKLHPFGYFRSSAVGVADSPGSKTKETIDIIYVGQLVHRKGLDVLLSALEPLFARYNKLQLQLIGSGDGQKELEDWVTSRNLSGRVTFEGAMNPRQITERISRADMLALPSRWDGWGLVVNEALMAGVPVVVSDMCGAADVVRDGVNGYVFRSEDVQDLREKLKTFLELSDARRLETVGCQRSVNGRREGSSSGSVSHTAMAGAAMKTGEALDPENAAEYLLRVLKGGEIKSEEISRYPWIAT